ncbi:SEC-C metal-binding domain-containing protein [Domibacillus sp. A3M-37]|uniref:SEC-C metal-binding domain-containing protein n=1 Tax=Domibacillus sp. A3M-37 TaxID=2962037 RepID=UPI0020B663E7|nr:SEC-C metal-binding domain-containing protein [Domibacillus sp. A3M-37]MCP3764812.1 SEC-C metal-binding domain-containing protein [Domibacillus sp. A3M-37]
MDLNNLKEAFDRHDVDTAAEILINTFNENPENFKKSLLLSSSLPEPFERTTTDQKVDTLTKAMLLAGKEIMGKQGEFYKFFSQAAQITDAINVIYQNAKSNSEIVGKNTYSEFSLPEQLQMYCIYIEDQQRLSKEKNSNDKGFFTGMESAVAKFSTDGQGEIKISETDRLESLIESADTLFRLLYYKGRRTIEKTVDFDHGDITPYGDASFEEIFYLSHQRNLLVDLWGKFKYREWEVKFKEEPETELRQYLFFPKNKEDFMKERIAIDRYGYRDHINLNKKHAQYVKENTESVHYCEEISKKLDVSNTEGLFQLNKKDFFKATVFIKNALNSLLESLDDIYFDIEWDGIKITDLFIGAEYLATLAHIYQGAVYKDFNQQDKSQYKKLAPILDKKDLIAQLSQLYDVEYGIAEKIINIFTFYGEPRLDIFSKPLVYVGRNMLIFCPTLILQNNVARKIEILVSELGIKIADKGIDFERELRFILSYNPHIQVNTNKIEFMAYDDRDVEFDFIGLFEDYLLLIEFKHLQRPFSDKEKRNALKTIDFGIEQVNRRENIIKKDWEKIKEQCSFELPDEVPNKIIKLICTNIFDFSTVVRQGVEIIDSSSLLKFFMSPNIKGVSIGGTKINESNYQNLWKENYPSVEEFIDFLEAPVAIRPFIKYYEGVYKPLVRFKEEDYIINFFDYSLTKDPYENIDTEIFGSTTPSQIVKVGRNEPCPCDSGKKYKKCCGSGVLRK